MAHFAKLNENNIVIDINVVSSDCLNSEDEEASGIVFLTEWSGGHSNWAQTSYNTKAGVHILGGTPFRKNYAGIGYTFDGVGFCPPQPYESWTLNSETYCWEAPVPYPADGLYIWNETDLAWEEITASTE